MKKIEENIRIHDKFQLEIKYIYPFDRNVPTTEYTVEHFFFVPSNLGINENNYSKEQFYGDGQKYIRLKTPVFTLRSMTSGEDNPLDRLRETLTDLPKDPENSEINRHYKYHLKMFCSIFKSAIRDEEVFIEHRLSPEDQKAAAEKVVNDIRETIDKFRALRPLVHSPHVTHKQMALFDFADEYMSILIEKTHFQALSFFEEGKKPEIF